jgi:hypothetical protein
VNNGVPIEIIHGGHDAILEFLFGCDADVAQDGAGEFGEEAFDEVEPGAVIGSEGEFEAVRGLIGEPRSGLLGDVRGMIVEDQLECRMGRIGSVENLYIAIAGNDTWRAREPPGRRPGTSAETIFAPAPVARSTRSAA